MQLIATHPTAATSSNPWGFPTLDPTVARRAVDGLQAGVVAVDRLIDRSIDVRVRLDRDLDAGVFSSDTVRAVQLLTRAREYALDTLEQRHLSYEVTEPVHDWARANAKDNRLHHVGEAIDGVRSAVANLLDDDEGNVADSIASMRTAPGRSSWQAVRDSLDAGIGSLYGSRDVYGALEVLRAAGSVS